MGRIAGVTAAKTRERLLHAAAEVFARRGYDGTRVSEIATAAGVSNGALYAHFGSKADLLVAALRAHGPRMLADMLAADPHMSAAHVLLAVGRGLPHRRDAGGHLIVEALVAARRDEDVARPMRDYLGERADWLAGLVRAAQDDGDMDGALSPDAVAHFCLLLALGSSLVPSGLHAVDGEEWAALITRVVGALAPDRPRDTDGSPDVKVHIDPERCQGHGRCYDLAPDLFGDDDEGYGTVLGDGVIPQDREQAARVAVANCPERAIDII